MLTKEKYNCWNKLKKYISIVEKREVKYPKA